MSFWTDGALTSTGRLSSDGDSPRITAKPRDVLLTPLESVELVVKTEVAELYRRVDWVLRVSSVSRSTDDRSEKAKRAETVAAVSREWDTSAHLIVITTTGVPARIDASTRGVGSVVSPAAALLLTPHGVRTCSPMQRTAAISASDHPTHPWIQNNTGNGPSTSFGHTTFRFKHSRSSCPACSNGRYGPKSTVWFGASG